MGGASKESWGLILTRIVLLAGFIAAIFYTLYLFATPELTVRESTLLGVQLAVCSIMASWLITHLYAARARREEIQEVQEKNQSNLRMYGLKAAEKVNNVSNELEKLSVYLEAELNFTDYASSDEELNAKEERIESAIHIIRTLKSVNDTSLSDWQGVIGEELDEQKQQRIENEEELSALVDRVEHLLEDQRQGLVGSQESTAGLRHELATLRRDLRTVVIELGRPTLLTKVERRGKREDVAQHCPSCGGGITYRQRAKSSSVKTITCPNCGAKLVARFNGIDGHYLEVRGPKVESVLCPECLEREAVWVDNVPGAGINVKCGSCGLIYRTTRSLEGVTVGKINVVAAPGSASAAGPSKVEEGIEKLLDTVYGVLPPQPWPTGIHKIVAAKLRLEPKTVSRVLTELMHLGRCKLQINGKLYAQIPAVAAGNGASEAKEEAAKEKAPKEEVDTMQTDK